MLHKKLWLLSILITALVVLAGCQQPPAAPGNLSIMGPESGVTNEHYSFVAAVEPLTTTVPLTYQWEVTGAAPISSTSGLTHTAEFTWDKPGTYNVTVTASNAAGKVSKSYKLVIAMPVPSDPLEAMRTVAEKQKEVKNQHIDLTMALNLKVNGLTGDQAQAAAFLKNFKASANISGDVDTAKEDFALKGDLDIGPLTAMLTQGADQLTFEMVKVGEKMYTKSNAGNTPDTWNTSDAPKSTTQMTSTNPLSPEMVTSLLKQSSKAEKLADEKIGEVDTYHYKVTMDPVALITAAADLAKSSGSGGSIDQAQLDQAKQLLKDATIEAEFWVGKQDLLITQAKIHVNVNLKNIPDQPGVTALIDFLLTDTVTKINQPVTITAPK